MPNPFINPPPADPTTQTLAILTNTCVGAFSQLLAALLKGQNQMIRAAQNACDLLERTCPGLKPLVDRIRQELEQPKRPS